MYGCDAPTRRGYGPGHGLLAMGKLEGRGLQKSTRLHDKSDADTATVLTRMRDAHRMIFSTRPHLPEFGGGRQQACSHLPPGIRVLDRIKAQQRAVTHRRQTDIPPGHHSPIFRAFSGPAQGRPRIPHTAPHPSPGSRVATD